MLSAASILQELPLDQDSAMVVVVTQSRRGVLVVLVVGPLRSVRPRLRSSRYRQSSCEGVHLVWDLRHGFARMIALQEPMVHEGLLEHNVDSFAS